MKGKHFFLRYISFTLLLMIISINLLPSFSQADGNGFELYYNSPSITFPSVSTKKLEAPKITLSASSDQPLYSYRITVNSTKELWPKLINSSTVTIGDKSYYKTMELQLLSNQLPAKGKTQTYTVTSNATNMERNTKLFKVTNKKGKYYDIQHPPAITDVSLVNGKVQIKIQANNSTKLKNIIVIDYNAQKTIFSKDINKVSDIVSFNSNKASLVKNYSSLNDYFYRLKILVYNNDGTYLKKNVAYKMPSLIKPSNSNNKSSAVSDTVVKKINGKDIKLPQGDKVYFLNTLVAGSSNSEGSDCFIIESNGMFGMIDTAVASKRNVVASYLKDLKIKELEFVLLTHAHGDHIGGYKYVNNKVKIKKLYIKDRNKSTVKEITDLAKKSGTTVCYVSKSSNQSIKLGNFQFKLYNNSDVIGNKTGLDENLNSIVALATVSGKTLYFSGDCENSSNIFSENNVAKQVYKDLEKLGKSSVDLYKAAHHGYDTSNCSTALEYLKPKNSVITNTKNRVVTKKTTSRINYYVDKAKGDMFWTGSGTIILNINEKGKMTFKQLSDKYVGPIK